MAVENIDQVGTKIKSLRKEQQITLKRLSEYTGFSIGFLSSVERNATSPSLQNLKQITEVLGTSITELLAVENIDKIIIRKDDAKIIQNPKSNQTITSFDFGSSPSISEIIVIQPGEAVEIIESRHIYDETCIIVSGQLTLELNDVTYILKKGDAAFIQKNKRHRIYNQSNQPCVSYWSYVKE